MKGLGRKYEPDVRDHLLRNAMVAVTRPKTKTWRLLWHGDQGDSPRCVGFAWYGLLRSSPILNREPQPVPLYEAAQRYDEWPGEGYEGTSVRGGAKALQQQFNELSAYAFAFTLDDALNWMGTEGPTVWGINWYSGMDTPDPKTGLVRVTGSIRGGHAIVCLGYNEYTDRLVFQNSWGLDWGLHGRFQVGYPDAIRLLSEDGEVCSPTEVHLP